MPSWAPLFRGLAPVPRRSACHALLMRLQFGDSTTADVDDDDDDDEMMTIDNRAGKLSLSETATGKQAWQRGSRTHYSGYRAVWQYEEVCFTRYNGDRTLCEHGGVSHSWVVAECVGFGGVDDFEMENTCRADR